MHEPANGSGETGRKLQLCATKGVAPSIVIERAHNEVLALCGCLEEIADSFPSRINQALCFSVAGKLVPLLSDVHRYEESILFPWLERAFPTKTMLHNSLRRLRSEHLEDEAFASEINEELLNIARGGQFQPETAGYMLRGFFESVRRHVACEREYLYELLEA